MKQIELDVLRAAGAGSVPQSVQDLALITGLKLTAVSGILNQFYNNNLVSVITSPVNGQYLYYLTNIGETFLKRLNRFRSTNN